MSEISVASYLNLLKNKSFLLFINSWLFTNLADGLLSVVLIFYAVEIGATSAQLGIIVFFITLARGFLGPIGGVISDRTNRRVYIFSLEIARASMVIMTVGLLYFELLSVISLTMIGVLTSTLFAISVPASKAIIPTLVVEKDVQLANGLVQAITWPAFFLGSIFLALMQDSFAVQIIFSVVGAGFAISAVLLYFLPSIYIASQKIEKITIKSFFRELNAGYHVLKINSVMHVRVCLYGFFTFLWRGTLQVCIPILVLRELESPQWIYGALMFTSGFAELVANLYVGKKTLNHPLVFTYWCEIIMAIGLFSIACSHWFPGTYVMLFVGAIFVGIAPAVVDIPLLTLIQKVIPMEHQGKVFSYWFAIGSCGGAFGALLMGVFFDSVAITEGVFVMAVCSLIIGVGFYCWAYKENKCFEDAKKICAE